MVSLKNVLFWPIFEKLKIEKFRFGIWSIFGEKPQNRTLIKEKYRTFRCFSILESWILKFRSKNF